MKWILSACVALVLGGCASNKEYYEAITAIAKTESIVASGAASALNTAAASSDPQVATAAAVGAGISEALRLSGRGGQQTSAVSLIPAPATALDYLREGRLWVLGAGSIWQQSDTVRQGTRLGMRQIDALIEGKKIESDERRDIMNSVTGNMARQTEAATKNPTNVTTINASGSATVATNGSAAQRSETTATINCDQTLASNAGPSGAGGSGAGGGNGTGTTAGSTGGAGGNGAPSGSGGAAQPTQRTDCKIEK